MSRHMNDEEVKDFGFRWGQLDVTRTAEFDGRKAVTVESDHHRVNVHVSATGRSVRVFKDGKELK